MFKNSWLTFRLLDPIMDYVHLKTGVTQFTPQPPVSVFKLWCCSWNCSALLPLGGHPCIHNSHCQELINSFAFSQLVRGKNVPHFTFSHPPSTKEQSSNNDSCHRLNSGAGGIVQSASDWSVWSLAMARH